MANKQLISIQQPNRGVHAVEVHHQTHESKRLAQNVDSDVDIERWQELESKVSSDPHFSRLILTAISLAAQRNKVLTGGEDPEAELAIAQKKEDELAELFDWSESQGIDEPAFNYMVKHAFGLPIDEEDLFHQSEPLPALAPDPPAEEVSPTVDRVPLKPWWRKGPAGVRTLFDAAEWASRWENPNDPVLTIGLIDAMTDKQAQKRKDHNRMVFMLAAGALVGRDADTAVAVAPAPVTSPTPQVAHQPEPVAPPDYYNLAEGETGVELFTNLGFSEDEWQHYENELVNQFPTDFERRASGSVKPSHAGPLSMPARAFISQIAK